MIRKIIEARLLSHGIDFASIQQMSEREVLEFFAIFQAIDEIKQEKKEDGH